MNDYLLSDFKHDLHALGLVLYKLMFGSEKTPQIIQAIQNHTILDKVNYPFPINFDPMDIQNDCLISPSCYSLMDKLLMINYNSSKSENENATFKLFSQWYLSE